RGSRQCQCPPKFPIKKYFLPTWDCCRGNHACQGRMRPGIHRCPHQLHLMATSPPHGSTTVITVNSLNALAQQKCRPCQNSFGAKLACTPLLGLVRGDGATCRQDRPESRYRRRHPVRRGGAVEENWLKG